MCCCGCHSLLLAEIERSRANGDCAPAPATPAAALLTATAAPAATPARSLGAALLRLLDGAAVSQSRTQLRARP